jgi:hypothetical protein
MNYKAWNYYDLGHGYCTDVEKCNQSVACAPCSFYVPKENLEQQYISALNNMLRFVHEGMLNEQEVLALSGDVEAIAHLIEKLRQTPTGDGRASDELDV